MKSYVQNNVHDEKEAGQDCHDKVHHRPGKDTKKTVICFSQIGPSSFNLSLALRAKKM